MGRTAKISATLATALGGLFIVLQGVAVLIGRQGPEYCLRNVADQAPHLLASHVVTGSMATRRISQEWVAAIVMTPADLHSDEVLTVVCYFGKNNYVLHRLDLAEGDRLQRVRVITESLVYPLTPWKNL